MALAQSPLPRVRPRAVFAAFVIAVGVVLNGLSRLGPHRAARQAGDFLRTSWGYLYDDSGEVGKPDRWLANAARTGVADLDLCAVSLTHVIGPCYRWAE